MLNEFIANEAVVYLLSFVLAIGVGLVLNGDSRRAGIGSMLITAVFVIVVSTRGSDAPLAVPLYVVTLGIVAVLSAVRRYSDSSLLVGEPYWRKVMLMFAHGGKIRSATLAQREENRQRNAV